MFDLKCKRDGCKYNKDCNCTAKEIHVNKDTQCQTYEDCGYDKKEKDEIKQKATRKNICVGCDAKCLFNKENFCKANGISVMTNDNHPECCTFLPK